MTVFVCAGPDRDGDKLRCRCCGFTSDDLDAFCMSTCWPCSGIGGGNPECANCVREGVWIDNFYRKSGKGHRLARRLTKRSKTARTVCGMSIPVKDIGQGTAVRDECHRCWPQAEPTSPMRSV